MSAFPDVSKIKYEGPDSKNPLAFRHYNATEMVDGKTMKDHLRFAVCYWHTFRGMGGDPFGPGCAVRPWEDGTDSLDMALKRVDVAFEFMDKLGVPFYCFHDRDVAPEGANLAETNKNLDAVVKKPEGWIVQIGAFPTEELARSRLEDARGHAGGLLAKGNPYTETTSRGSTTLYRARFAGFDEATAREACNRLKKNDFACFTTRN